MLSFNTNDILQEIFKDGDIYTNNFGVNFKTTLMKMEDGIHQSKIYQCQSCGKVLKTKEGAIVHKCLNFLKESLHKIDQNKHAIAFENFLRYIASSDTPYNATDNEFLRYSYQVFDDTFNIPSPDKLSYEMDRLSKKIHNEMLSEIKGMSVSLLFDGIRRWSQDYQGIILFTSKRLYLWGIIHTVDSTAPTISNEVAEIISSLKDNGTNVIAICCDNAASNVKAFNGDDKSTQKISHSHFIRQSCAAHTSSLAKKDIFSDGKIYDFVVHSIKYLLSHSPKVHKNGKVPDLFTIRWESLLKCTKYINKNYNLYLEDGSDDVLQSLEIVEKIIGWENTEKIFQIVWDFISLIEKDLTSIDQIVLQFIHALNQLYNMPIMAAHDMANSLQHRFIKTCPFQLLLFSFLVTKQGLIYFRQKWMGNEEIIDNTYNAIFKYQVERQKDDKEFFQEKEIFKDYLMNFNINCFNNFRCSFDMWMYFEKHPDQIKMPLSFIILAKEVLLIPATEAAVERLFSHLSYLTSAKLCNTKVETLNSRLIVKFDKIFKRVGAIKWTDLPSQAF